jgi:LysM repeat protein
VPASVAASFEALQAKQEKEKAAKEAKDKEETVEVDQWKTHTVKKGETIAILAAKYKTTAKDIKQWNNLKSNFVRPGQNLKIKFKVTKKVSAVAPPKTVTPVETLTREQLERLLDQLPGTEITPEIANQISAEESTRISEEFGNELGDDVSLPDDNLIEIMGVKYPKNDINSKLLTSLGLSAQEANEILKLIC